MKGPLISSKKVQLSSEYNYFDLLPIKKYHECSIRIPETLLLQKGYIKDWVFNSHKLPSHPILKKRKENLSTFAAVKSFCTRNGYGQAIHGCGNIREIREKVKEVLKEQKDYDFIKDKKVVEITTVSNQVLAMNLVDFLDYVSQNKYSEQNFYQKWKMVQEKVSYTKIDQYYQVQNVRNNHVIQSKCQKIISVNTTQATILSTELQQDPYKKTAPAKNFQIAQTKNIEGYKFFDTFLNKKFFQMSTQLIEFIQKNLKCLVESVVTKFVINKQRQPYLFSIQSLDIKPAKKIADMKEFLMAKQKGFIKIQQYQRCLDTYIHENMERYESFNLNTPISDRKRCKGKFCKLPLEQINLPPLLQAKLKLPTLSANTRVILLELRDAVQKRKRKVIEKMMENHIISPEYQIQDQSSEYQSEGNQDIGAKLKQKHLKICQNCYIFYFHVNRFFQLDMYGNMVEKKTPITGSNNLHQNPFNKNQIMKTSKERGLSFLTKQQIKRQRYKNLSPSKQPFDKDLQQITKQIADKKLQQQQKAQFEIDIKPVTSSQSRKQSSIQKKPEKEKILQKSKSNPKTTLSPLKKQKQSSLNKTGRQIKSDKKFPLNTNAKSKIKLDPLNPKQIVTQNSLSNNPTQTKAHCLLALAKISPMKMTLQQRSKSKTMQPLSSSQPRPQSHSQAISQLLSKLSTIPCSSAQQFIHYSKKYFSTNLPQPLSRFAFSTYYHPSLYQFMSQSPIAIHPKCRIKKRPEMSMHRLAELTDYPEIVSRSEFVFDTVIVNQQTTVPYCVITSEMVRGKGDDDRGAWENLVFFNDIFDCFIQHVSMVKELLEEAEGKKRVILWNYPGQSHTIYNRGNVEGYFAYFGEVFDKMIYRLSGEKGEKKLIDLEKDVFKFCGFGIGGNLLAHYLSSYSQTFPKISSVMLVNSFMQFPKKYTEALQSLLTLYRSNEPLVSEHAHLYYNKVINSQQTSQQQMQHKSGLNPIRIQDRIYLLSCILSQVNQSQTQTSSIQPQYFQLQSHYQVSSIYGKNNALITKQNAKQWLYYRNGGKGEIDNRVFVEIDGGHDIFADNYQDIARILGLFCKK